MRPICLRCLLHVELRYDGLHSRLDYARHAILVGFSVRWRDAGGERERERERCLSPPDIPCKITVSEVVKRIGRNYTNGDARALMSCRFAEYSYLGPLKIREFRNITEDGKSAG